MSRAAQGCSPSSWPGTLDEAALHSPALGLQHPLALPWDQQALKVPVSPVTSGTALSLSCRQPRLSCVRVPLGWGRVSINIPSSQAFLPHRPSLAHHPCLARLASRSHPAGSKSGAGGWGSYSPPRQPQAPTLMAARCGGQHTHHLSRQPRDTRWALQWRHEQKSSSIPGTRNSKGVGLGCCKYLPLGRGGQGVLVGPCCLGGQASPAMETATSERGWHSQDLGCPCGKVCWGVTG